MDRCFCSCFGWLLGCVLMPMVPVVHAVNDVRLNTAQSASPGSSFSVTLTLANPDGVSDSGAISIDYDGRLIDLGALGVCSSTSPPVALGPAVDANLDQCQISDLAPVDGIADNITFIFGLTGGNAPLQSGTLATLMPRALATGTAALDFRFLNGSTVVTGFKAGLAPLNSPGSAIGTRIVLAEDGGGDDFAINFGLTGGWYELETAGQGLLVEVLPSIQQLFVAWFTYEQSSTKIGAGEHRWMTAQGTYLGDQATLDLFVTSGGVFDDPQVPTTVPAGQAVLRFQSCDQASFEYSLDGGPSGDMDLVRVSPNTDCSQFLEGR